VKEIVRTRSSLERMVEANAFAGSGAKQGDVVVAIG
jgi:hypothetical protein